MTARPTGPGAACHWCRQPIPAISPDTGRKVRTDAETCSRRCRQARWRLRRTLERQAASTGDGSACSDDTSPGSPSDASLEQPATARRSRRRVAEDLALERPARFAYADPPYVGRARRYYGDQDTYAGEVDHRELIDRLEVGYPDGWALSAAADSLDLILPMCPPSEWHLCPWIKPGRPPDGTLGLHCCWETLIVVRARQRKPGRRDWLLAQPARYGFAAFLFQALGLVDEHGDVVDPADELHDLYPGTGIIGRAWADLSASAAAQDDASPRAARSTDDGSEYPIDASPDATAPASCA